MIVVTAIGESNSRLTRRLPVTCTSSNALVLACRGGGGGAGATAGRGLSVALEMAEAGNDSCGIMMSMTGGGVSTTGSSIFGGGGAVVMADLSARAVLDCGGSGSSRLSSV